MRNWARHHNAARAAGLAGICALILALSPTATADVALSTTALSIEVSSDSGSAILEVPRADLVWDADAQVLSWNPGGAVQIADGGVNLAVLESLQFAIQRCGKINLSLSIRAGAADIDVVARSGLLEFPAVAAGAAEAQAFASFTLRDLDSDGSCVSGLPADGTGIFRAYYNGDPDSGTRFAHLIALISAGSGGTASAFQSSPTVGYGPIGCEVYSLATELAFTLSDNDRLTASTSFDLIPKPDTCSFDWDEESWPDGYDGDHDAGQPDQPGDGAPADQYVDPSADIAQSDDGASPSGQPDKPELADSSGDNPPNESQTLGASIGLDQLPGGGVALCGAGMLGFLPLMLLGLAAARSTHQRRFN
jgi:hypothetical protein